MIYVTDIELNEPMINKDDYLSKIFTHFGINLYEMINGGTVCTIRNESKVIHRNNVFPIWEIEIILYNNEYKVKIIVNDDYGDGIGIEINISKLLSVYDFSTTMGGYRVSMDYVSIAIENKEQFDSLINFLVTIEDQLGQTLDIPYEFIGRLYE